jgi:hypothetical protein
MCRIVGFIDFNFNNSYSLNIKKIKYAVFLLLILPIAFYLFLKFAFPSLYIDINKGTSFSTRFSGLISVVLVLVSYPLGLGYGSYLSYYPQILDRSYEIANVLFTDLSGISLSYAEISDIISTGENIGAKAGIPQAVILSGWVGVIFLIFRNSLIYIKRLDIKTSKKIILEFLTLCMFIQLLIGSEYTLLYVIWLPIALIEVMYYKQREAIRNEA